MPYGGPSSRPRTSSTTGCRATWPSGHRCRPSTARWPIASPRPGP